MSHAASAGLTRAGDAIRETGGTMRHRAGVARRSAAGTSHYMRNSLDTLIEDQPLVAGAIAIALGAAVGGALPGSRVEDRRFGEWSDRAMESVRTLANDEGAKVKATAGAVVNEALNIAGEASTDSGRSCPPAKRSWRAQRARRARRRAGCGRQGGLTPASSRAIARQARKQHKSARWPRPVLPRRSHCQRPASRGLRETAGAGTQGVERAQANLDTPWPRRHSTVWSTREKRVHSQYIGRLRGHSISNTPVS
jgi:hypothetical protein